MNLNDYHSGELEVDATAETENRHKTSIQQHNEHISSIIIISAIVALALMMTVFFVLFTEDSLPAWNPQDTTTTTTTKKPGGSNDPDTKYPYATKTDKTNFIASVGGNDLSGVYLYSEYAILIKLSDMTTVAHQGADTVMYPASMTKVMTVVVALDLITDLDDGYIVEQGIVDMMPDGASNAGLINCVGKMISVRDLLYGVSYLSAADSVLCLIDYLNLTVEQFVRLMNEKAETIGLQNTVFGGAIGMDDEENRSTVRDIAAIMAYAMENPLCREIFGGTAYRLDYLPTTYYNSTLHKNLVNNFGSTPETIVNGYTLVATKSGFEVNAGYCLVSLLKNNETGEEFILVTANSKAYAPPYNKAPILDMIELFDEFKP